MSQSSSHLTPISDDQTTTELHVFDSWEDELRPYPKTSHVPFNKPAFIGPELDAVKQAILEHHQISGAGHFTRLCQSKLTQIIGSPTLLTSSCTSALEMAAILLELQPHDEVIVPSFTFVSTANAFALRQCRIRFADCDTYGQICLDSIKRLITPKTKAVCAVHYASHSTDMVALRALCDSHGLFLVEDAAQALGSQFQGKPLGTYGHLATLSFHETKNVTSGEGGALIINDQRFLERAHYLREKGTNRQKFMDGLVDKYTWVDVGSNYLMSEMNAAYLSVQLDHLEAITRKRQYVYQQYFDRLSPQQERLGFEILQTPLDNTSNYHMFALLFDQPAYRKTFIKAMKAQGIVAVFHYVALHTSPFGQSYAVANESYTQTMRFSDCLVRLPLFYNLTSWQQDHVINTIDNFQW